MNGNDHPILRNKNMVRSLAYEANLSQRGDARLGVVA